MSVINQMLRDLDERQGKQQRGTHQGVGLATAKSTTWMWPVSIAVVVVILALLFREPISSWMVKEQPPTSTVSDVSENTAAPVVESVSQNEPEATEVARPVETKTKETITSQPKDQVIAKEELVTVPDQLEPMAALAETADEVISEQVDDSTPKVLKTSPARDKREQAEALYEQLLAANGQVLTISQMENILAIDPDFHKVRILWLSRLSQANQAQFQIEVQRAINNYSDVFQYRQMLARSLVVKEPRQAYELLTAELPTINQAPDYHGLIAYSAKQMGEYDLASRQYQLLLQQYPERADWWLALGVTEEQLGKSASALAAYQQSLRFPGLAANTRAWAQQRITALQGF